LSVRDAGSGHFQEHEFLSELSDDLKLHVQWSRYKPFLLRLPLFRNCSQLLVQRLAQNFRTKTWAKHDVIFEEGDDGEELYIVMSGSVRLSNASIDIVLDEGSTFGELSLMTSTEQQRRAAATARSMLTLAVLDKSNYLKVADCFPLDRVTITMNCIGCYDLGTDVDILDLSALPVQTLRLQLEEIFWNTCVEVDRVATLNSEKGGPSSSRERRARLNKIRALNRLNASDSPILRTVLTEMQVHAGKIEKIIGLLEAQGDLDFVGFSSSYLGKLESRFEQLWRARETVSEAATTTNSFVPRASLTRKPTVGSLLGGRT
jgi:hypothetical protein